MKHFHLMMVAITLGLFFYQFSMVMFAKQNNAFHSKKLFIATHIIYTFLMISGILTALPLLKAGIFPHWLVAKVVLLIVAISATIKATRKSDTPAQTKMGLLIAMVAYAGIVILAIVKPLNLF